MLFSMMIRARSLTVYFHVFEAAIAPHQNFSLILNHPPVMQSQNYTPALWVNNFTADRFAHIIHTEGQPQDVQNFVDLAQSRNAGAIYVTDDVLANPYDKLPSYWTQQVNAVDTTPSTGATSEPVELSATNSINSRNETTINGKTIDSWVYQLQGTNGNALDLNPLKSERADLAVIDYSRDGSEKGEFTATEIQALKNSGKLVLGYMQIGGADAGRFYDRHPNDSPNKLFSTSEGNAIEGPVNQDFEGTSFVKYWRKDWQDIIFGDNALPQWVANFSQKDDNYLERIQKARFDGVYLDDIDGYQQFNQDGNNSRPGDALEMVLFINRLSTWAKARNPNFVVFAQNAENIFNDALKDLDTNGDEKLTDADKFLVKKNGTLYLNANPRNNIQTDVSLARLDANSDAVLSKVEIEAAYFDAIDGLGSEDFFFKGDKDENNQFVDDLNSPKNLVDDFKFTAENYLKYAANGKPIFNVEYLTDNATQKLNQYRQITSDNYQFKNQAITTNGDAAAFTNEELDRLTIVPFSSPSRDLDRLPNKPFAELSNVMGTSNELTNSDRVVDELSNVGANFSTILESENPSF